METLVDWSNLPNELLTLIGNLLQTRVDVTLFRSVCSSWRSSRPPYRLPRPPPPLPLTFSPPSPFHSPATLLYVTTYRVDPTSVDHHPNPFLLKLQLNPVTGESRLLDPITLSPLNPNGSPSQTRKEFSLLDFNLVELRRCYVIDYSDRVVVMPCTFSDYSHVSGIFSIDYLGKLAFVRFGDDKLTHVDENNLDDDDTGALYYYNKPAYDDIALYKGQCYVIDKSGVISWIRVSGVDAIELKLVQFSRPLGGFEGKKYLLEFEGDLHVVDQHINFSWDSHWQRNKEKTSGFRVYKLDQEWGRWVEVKELGDWIFVLSKDESFAVSSREFGDGVEGNCILFPETVGFRCYSNRVFSLEDGKISKLKGLHAQMVKPPSSWLDSD